VLGLGSAHATALTWTLHDATFRDGTATGSFVFDFATDFVTDFDISVSQGAGPFSAFRYTPATATVQRASRVFFSLQTDQPFGSDPSALRHFDLGFGSFIPGNPGCACSIPLSEAGGTVPIFVVAGSREQFGNTFDPGIRWMEGGTVVASAPAVPEPGTAPFILAGLVALGGMTVLRCRRPPPRP
jgi:hypothetical protein